MCSPGGYEELDMTERLNNNNISLMNIRWFTITNLKITLASL